MDELVIEEHLRWLRRITDSHATLRDRRDNLRRLSRNLPVALLDATESDLDRWQSDLGVGKSSLLTYTTHVRAFYAWAHDRGKRDDNPAVALPLPKIPDRKPRPIPEDALKTAFRCADAEMMVWLALAGWVGCRAGEIAKLEDTSVIDEPDGMLLRIDGKGGKERIVPVPSVMVPMIRGVLRKGRLFRTPTGLLANGQYVTRVSSAFFAGIGLPYTLHQLRHRFGTQHYRLCKDIRQTQELMGHSSPSTTAKYVALAHRGGARSMDRLGKSLPRVAP
jgi:integrase/recombinase XerC